MKSKHLTVVLTIALVVVIAGICGVLMTKFSTPTGGAVGVTIDGDHVLGPEDAPVTIIEFSDFQCPFCKRGAETAKEMVEKYEGKVKLIFKHMPLSFHNQARGAALASECAAEQGKFWEFHDIAFENNNNLGIDSLKTYASQLGLDTEQFNACLDDEKYAAKIEADMAAFKESGASGTPAFVINGELVVGAQPAEVFEEAIDKALGE